MQCVYRDDQYQTAQTQTMNVQHEINKKNLEVRIITDKRNQDKHEQKTLEDSKRAIKNKELEFAKLKEENKNAMIKFEVAQRDRLEQSKRANAKSIEEMEMRFEKEKQQNGLNMSEIDKQRELITQRANGKLYRLGKTQDMSRVSKKFDVQTKKENWDLQKTKMSDKKYDLHLRQNLIKSVYQNLNYQTEFNFNSNDGENCLVKMIDTLIAEQSKV